GDDAQYGHANRDAVGDLFPDDGTATVSEAGFDLDAAVHRPRMHDDGVRCRQLHPFVTDTVVGEVLVDTRYAIEVADALALDAQRHHHVGAAKAVIEPVHDPRRGQFGGVRRKRARGYEAD